MKSRMIKRLSLVLGLTLALSAFSGLSIASNNNSNNSNKVETSAKKKNESRINGLILGTDGGRTDTIMFMSYDYKNNKVDIVSIPRDTYINYNKAGAGFKKINSVYQVEGFKGLSKQVRDVLGDNSIKIDKYVKLDYEGAKRIIDSVGGVEVNVPPVVAQNTETLTPGLQTLKGDQAIEYLRQRYGYDDGDLGRVSKQQDFVKSFMLKAKENGIPSTAKTILSEIDTNVGVFDGIYYGFKLRNIKKEDITMHVLPGNAETKTVEGETLSYYISDKKEAKKLIEEIME